MRYLFLLLLFLFNDVFSAFIPKDLYTPADKPNTIKISSISDSHLISIKPGNDFYAPFVIPPGIADLKVQFKPYPISNDFFFAQSTHRNHDLSPLTSNQLSFQSFDTPSTGYLYVKNRSDKPLIINHLSIGFVVKNNQVFNDFLSNTPLLPQSNHLEPVFSSSNRRFTRSKRTFKPLIPDNTHKQPNFEEIIPVDGAVFDISQVTVSDNSDSDITLPSEMIDLVNDANLGGMLTGNVNQAMVQLESDSLDPNCGGINCEHGLDEVDPDRSIWGSVKPVLGDYDENTDDYENDQAALAAFRGVVHPTGNTNDTTPGLIGDTPCGLPFCEGDGNVDPETGDSIFGKIDQLDHLNNRVNQLYSVHHGNCDSENGNGIMFAGIDTENVFGNAIISISSTCQGILHYIGMRDIPDDLVQFKTGSNSLPDGIKICIPMYCGQSVEITQSLSNCPYADVPISPNAILTTPLLNIVPPQNYEVNGCQSVLNTNVESINAENQIMPEQEEHRQRFGDMPAFNHNQKFSNVVVKLAQDGVYLQKNYVESFYQGSFVGYPMQPFNGMEFTVEDLYTEHYYIYNVKVNGFVDMTQNGGG